ncbi:unnamed protein product, partial [Oikopleura dioica]
EEAQYDKAVERQSTLEETLPESTDPGLIHLATSLLKYSPKARATPLKALKNSPFFEPLQDRETQIKLPNGKVVAMDIVCMSPDEEQQLGYR